MRSFRTNQQPESNNQMQSATQMKSMAPPAFSVDASPVQMKGPEKKVSSGAMGRLSKAQEAINYTKSVLKFGAGNQKPALAASRNNSRYRLQVVRNNDFWDIDPSVAHLVASDWFSFHTAKSEIAQGGNCGEHAMLAFKYLRANAPGETISSVSVSGIDHAFTLIGNYNTESHENVAASDPWPNSPLACLWPDHFCYESDNSEVSADKTMVADGKNKVDVIKAGIKLNDKGKKALEKKDNRLVTKLDQWFGPGYEGYDDAHAEGKEYTYVDENKDKDKAEK